ncbi:NAD-glutamate dehydrogenase [candidate division KSB1 bacterium]|nr:NAD-glutamate dehydrogenase [candidate division KSB1 bacterium]
MDILTEASNSSGLSVDDLKKIEGILVERGNFPAARIREELYRFCCKIGMVKYYFLITPLKLIADHIESFLAAEIIAQNSGGKELNVNFHSILKNSAMYLLNDDHNKAVEIERRLEKNFPVMRLQSYRTSGMSMESHFRSYFAASPDYASRDVSPTETDIYKVADKQFIATTSQEAIGRYQKVLNASIHALKPFIEVTDPVRDEIRIMISIPQKGSFRFFSGISDVINYYGLVTKHKYVEPFANGRIIYSFYLDAEKTRPHLDNLITDISLIYVRPENELSPLFRNGSLSAHELFYAMAAWKFTHQFLTGFSYEYQVLAEQLKDQPELMGILSNLRIHLVKDAYTEPRIVLTIFNYPDVVKTLYQDFAARFSPAGNGHVKTNLAQVLKTEIHHDIDRHILEGFLLFNHIILKTNFYKKNKTSLAFRMDPKFLDEIEFPISPFGIFMILGSEFRGFHVRFRDVARGGIRLVRSIDVETYDQNSDSIFDENYNLAATQQKKNKDIPEGGSKGTILLGMEAQNEPEMAFKKYIDGLLDVLLPDDAIKDNVAAEEILFLGPDEGTAELMNWAMERARERGYKFWRAFSTGKSLELGGIPHDVYGMTTNSVHEYVLGIIEKLNLKEENLTKVQTGGPDGDLGSNEILISKDKTIGIIDGSGVLYDPRGLDRKELTRLAKARQMVEHFDRAKLSPEGFLVAITDRNVKLPNGETVLNGTTFRNEFHLNPMLKADLFVPCGGRPQSINIQNWKQMLDESGKPRFQYIIEGANLFITQAARLELEKKGVIIYKDASANKGGVTSSSLEVFASLALTDEEFTQYMCVTDGKESEFRQNYVGDVLNKIRSNARMEFEVIWNEHQASQTPMSILTDRLSDRINMATDSIHDSNLCDNESLFKKVIAQHCPKILVETVSIETIMTRAPKNYLKAIFASWLASHFIYKYGLHADEIDFYEFLSKVSKM